jgi:hypothetical protein
MIVSKQHACIRLVQILSWITFCLPAVSQDTVPDFSHREISRIINFLASDDMRGRKTFTPDIEKAADFIAGEFQSAGLQPWHDAADFRQKLTYGTEGKVSVDVEVDGASLNENDVVVFSTWPQLTVDTNSGFNILPLTIRHHENTFLSEAIRLLTLDQDLIVIVDPGFKEKFQWLRDFSSSISKAGRTVIFLRHGAMPKQYRISFTREVLQQSLTNLIGFLPGNSKPEEIIIFSAHYDHIGVSSKESKDSIYNGANDNAAGVTAVIMLARHFGKLKNNERSILFVCFAGEEMGLIGSSYFVDKIEPGKVVAVCNIEMIGTRSPWGKNSAYIVGYGVTDLGRIIRKNASLSGFTLRSDPYPKQNLFSRSDHYSFFKRGIPAITFMSARMDTDPHYHKVTDEVRTLDLDNMAKIIEGIALASGTLISGKETPRRK